MGKKGKRYSPRFQFQVVLEVRNGDRDAVEIVQAHNLHPTTVARWKRESLENGPEVFGRSGTVAQYEKRISDWLRGMLPTLCHGTTLATAVERWPTFNNGQHGHSTHGKLAPRRSAVLQSFTLALQLRRQLR